jgi:type VI protein secretion system component VasA
MSLHEIEQDEANQRRIQGVRSAKLKTVREMVSGSLVTGNLLALVLEEDHFTSPGDIQMFCRVLAGFLGAYASINSFMRLAVVLAPSGRRIYMERTLGEAGTL